MDIFSKAYMLLFLRFFVCVCVWQNDHNNKRYEQTTLLSSFSTQKEIPHHNPQNRKKLKENTSA